MMRPSCLALAILLLISVVSSDYGRSGSRRQHRCKVENLRFQRHVDLKRGYKRTCITMLAVCRLVKPPGPECTWTLMDFPGIPTMKDIFLAETDYVGYLVFYSCLEKANDGTCAKPIVVIESRTEEMTRRQKSAVSRVLRRLCVDESTLVSIRQGPRCPEPDNIPFRPLSQPISDFL